MPKACNFIKKDTLAQVLSCEICEISKNTFFTEHLWTTASKQNKTIQNKTILLQQILNTSHVDKSQQITINVYRILNELCCLISQFNKQTDT